MNYEIKGQEDMTLAVGAGGDETTTIPITGNHLMIRTDTGQPVIYSTAVGPSFPADWNRLDPMEKTEFATAAANLYVRKKVYYRGIGYGQTGADLNDVTANIEVDQFNQS